MRQDNNAELTTAVIASGIQAVHKYSGAQCPLIMQKRTPAAHRLMRTAAQITRYGVIQDGR
jgi:hypothetical protein